MNSMEKERVNKAAPWNCLFNQGYRYVILITLKEKKLSEKLSEKHQWILPIPSSSLHDIISSSIPSDVSSNQIFCQYKEQILKLLEKWLYSTTVVDRAMNLLKTHYQMSVHQIVGQEAEIYIPRRYSWEHIRIFKGTVLNFPVQTVKKSDCKDIIIEDVVQWTKLATNLEKLFFPIQHLHLTLAGCTTFPELDFPVYSTQDILCKFEDKGWDAERKVWLLNDYTYAKDIYFKNLMNEPKKLEEENKVFSEQKEEVLERRSKKDAKKKLQKLFFKFSMCECECQCGFCHSPSCEKFYFSRYSLQRPDCSLPDMLLGLTNEQMEENYFQNRKNKSQYNYEKYARKFKVKCNKVRGCYKNNCKRTRFFKTQTIAKPLCEYKKKKKRILSIAKRNLNLVFKDV